MASTRASISKAFKRLKINIILPKQLFVDLTQDDTKTLLPKHQLSSLSAPNAPSKIPSTKGTSSSYIDYIPKSPTSSTSPSTNGYLNSLISPPLKVPPPPLTQEDASMDITLTLSPITPLDFSTDAKEVARNIEVPIVLELEIPRKTVNLLLQACLNFTKVESDTVAKIYRIEEKEKYGPEWVGYWNPVKERDNEALRNIIEKRNELFVTLYKDGNKKVKEDDKNKDGDLEKDDDDEEIYGDNDDDDETDRDSDDEKDGDNDDNDEDDDDENDDNDENDENIRNDKEKKGGSDNVEDDNVEEGIADVEQKDENVEEEKEKEKVPDDMVWDKTKAIVPFEDYHDYEINDTQSSTEDAEYNDNVSGVTHVIDVANVVTPPYLTYSNGS
ncbi:hypothetical protein Tco_0620519 [Tanacetum coccineum]